MSIRTGKKGTYIVEATICLPILIIAVVVMNSLILYYCCIEDASFIMAEEMRRGALEAGYLDAGLLIPYRVEKSAMDNHSSIENMSIRDFGVRENYGTLDETMRLTYRMKLRTRNPVGIAGQAYYDASLMTRAYVGKIRDVPPMDRDEFLRDGSESVYIFPKDGERFHNKSCTYVNAAPDAVILDDNIMSRYSKCPLCHSGDAEAGTVVYIFRQYGEAFHKSRCSSIRRKCIEVELDIARERGYTACTKCGG